MTGYLGVYDENRDIVAMINGGDEIHDLDESHGKILIASGMNGLDPSGVHTSTFKVFEDGHVECHDLYADGVDISGRVTAGSGRIGPLVINQDYLHGDYSYPSTGAESSINLSPHDFTVYNKRPVLGSGGRVNSTGTFQISDQNQNGFVETNYDRANYSGHPEPALYVSATNSAIALEVSGGVFVDGTLSGRIPIRTTDLTISDHDGTNITLEYRDCCALIDVATSAANITMSNSALSTPGFTFRIAKTVSVSTIKLITSGSVNYVLLNEGKNTTTTASSNNYQLPTATYYEVTYIGQTGGGTKKVFIKYNNRLED